jgi:queuine/archaeosine tRNA-ribosyltransferase
MQRIKDAIKKGEFEQFAKSFLEKRRYGNS